MFLCQFRQNLAIRLEKWAHTSAYKAFLLSYPGDLENWVEVTIHTKRSFYPMFIIFYTLF